MTIQGDMYSYGVLLLKLFTGKKPTDNMFGEDMSLHQYCKLALSEKSIIEIMDSRLLIASERLEANRKLEIQECLTNFVKIGVSCSTDLPGERMGIKDVLVELLGIKQVFLPNRYHHVYA